MSQKNLAKLVKLLLISALFAATAAAATRFESRPELHVDFLDVGQGDSELITSPAGFQILIDGGPNQKVLSALRQVMPVGDTTIDWVINTHPDADHLAGLVDVITDYRVARVLMPQVEKDTALYKTWLKNLDEAHIPITYITSPQTLTIDNLTLRFLHPSSQTFQPGDAANNASIVLRLDYGQRSFLFTGDMERPIEERLLTVYGPELDVDVLKVAHHGSKTSSILPFIQAVSPKLAVIEVGARNRYGHPSPEVLQRYQQEKSRILRTDELGTIHLGSDGHDLWLDQGGFSLGPWLVGKQRETVYTGSKDL